jgi:hypothetical protein
MQFTAAALVMRKQLLAISTSSSVKYTDGLHSFMIHEDQMVRM